MQQVVMRQVAVRRRECELVRVRVRVWVRVRVHAVRRADWIR